MFFGYCLDRIIKGILLKNNGAEAWNNSIKNRTQKTHLNVGRFIETLQNEKEMTRFKIIQLKSVIFETNSNAKYLMKERNVFDCISSYQLY